VYTKGYVTLLTTFGTSMTYQTLIVRYILVEADTSYNAFINHRTLKLGVIISIPHMAIKFPSKDGTIITRKYSK